MVSYKKIVGIVLLSTVCTFAFGADNFAFGADKKMSADEISFMATEMYQKNNAVCAKSAHNDGFIAQGLNSLADEGLSTTIPVLQTLIYEKCMYQLYLQNFVNDSQQVERQ